MSTIKKLRWPLALVLFTIALSPIFLMGSASSSSSNYFEIDKNMDIYISLYKELNTYYVDEVDPNKIMREGIDAMLGSLDPYTNYISEAEIENYRLQTTGKYGGIGALIRKQGDYVLVAEPYEGYPADRAGLMAGDVIIEVGGKSTEGKSTDDVSKILKGQPGTSVDVRVLRPNADGGEDEMVFTLDREEIKINNVPYYGMIDEEVGYIHLAHFTDNAGAEVRDAFQELKENNNLKGLVLDLRGNPGGLLNEAVNVTGVFVEKGQEVVSTKGKVSEWNKTFRTTNQPVDTDLPLVVIVNTGSASASEIVSGSIQDLDRGLVVGQTTFGKGLVQTTRSLPYNTKLKVTTAKYYIPSGRCIQAINYADENNAKIPDSLRSEFFTQGGRAVYDGAGIEPDISTEEYEFSNVSVALFSNQLIFDYATLFRARNENIASPREFGLNDEEFEQFVVWLQDKEYDYTTESEQALEELQEAAEKEEYYSAIEKEFKELQEKMMHDKKQDLYKQKEEVLELLEEEIVLRYYYKSGQIESSFKYDNDLQTALEVIKDDARYTALLSPK
jgi:carboxyl-terminal processing protease